MTRLYNKQSLKFRRKRLRNGATKEERLLWKLLRVTFKNARFRRQYSVGFYTLDFYSVKHRLAIELDGKYHKDAAEYDREGIFF